MPLPFFSAGKRTFCSILYIVIELADVKSSLFRRVTIVSIGKRCVRDCSNLLILIKFIDIPLSPKANSILFLYTRWQ